MTPFHTRFPILILACFLASALAGCRGERESEPSGESPEQTAPARPAAGPSAGPEVPKGGQLPAGFPADVPAYPGATIQNSISIPDESTFVTYLTSASPEEVYGYYHEQLQTRGWTVSEASDDEHRLEVDKEGRKVSIMIIASGAQTEVGISIQGN